MFGKICLHRHGVTVLQLLFILYVLTASVVALWHPHCRAETRVLTFDGVCVGVLLALTRLLNVLRRRRLPTLVSLYCVTRLMLTNYVKDGVAGGYFFGITVAAVRCL